MSSDVLGILTAVVAQGGPAGGPADGGVRDFRGYVWAAYGAVIVLLFLFSLWSVAQLRGAERKLERLQESLDRSKGQKAPARE